MIASLLHRARRSTGDPVEVDLTEEGARIASWLPYSSYRPADKVFINRDSLGFVLAVTAQTGASTDTAERLKGLYARLPTDATMQIHLWASPNISQTLRAYANLRTMDSDYQAQAALRGGRPARNANVFRTMARRRYAFLRQASHEPFSPDVAFLVRDFRVFVSVTLPGSIRELNRVDELLEIRDGIKGTLSAAQFPACVIGADELLELVGEWLNPARLRGKQMTALVYDDFKLLSEQVVDRETSGDWADPSKVVLEQVGGEPEDNVELRFLSLQRTPKSFALWGMGALIGDMFQDSLQLPCPFLVTMGVSVPDQLAVSSSAVADKAEAARNASGDLAKYSPQMQERNEHWDNALKALSNGGKLVWCYHQVVLFARPGQGKAAVSALRDLWRARGFELVLDAYIHRAALLQSLPMGMSKPFVADLQRLRRLEMRTSGNTIHLAPLIAEGKGTGTPTMLGIGRRGQLAAFDFFDNAQGGKNVAIVGAVGSGKSTLLQEIATSYASRGAKVRVFEVGRSFERLTKRVGGQFFVFTHAARPNVNPFSLVSSQVLVDGEMRGGIDDDVALLQPLLAKMASPDRGLDPAIYATLATVIKEEYEQSRREQRVMTVTDVMRRYRTGRLYPDRPEDQRYYDMADMLAPFSAGGPYEKYFEGQSNLDFSNDFLVFEMQELAANPHLRSVVQMILLYRVSREMLEERRRQKIFIMDEAKEALAGNGADDEVMARFLDALYVRVRKYNGSAITATQDVAHYFTSPYGASIWNQSEYILMGKQSENSIEAIAKGEAIRLDDHLRRVLTSINTNSGAFREWYIHSGLFRGVVRLVLNPSTLLLYSNRAEDNVPLDAALARGLDVPQAIEEVLRQRGIEEPQ
ncbi:MAG: type IV secretion system protein TraC [Rubrivivax sp.]|nr:type IV secretion system protein TraC [Rubrivivax sp.]